MPNQPDVQPHLIVPIILAGGKGTRLWPLSRASRPKQFLQLTDDLSLFQQTLKRLQDPNHYAAPIVVTNEEYRFLVAEQALEMGVNLQAILLEPVARNTAPAIAAATMFAAATNAGQLVHVLPSDHDILVDAAYEHALNCAAKSAGDGLLVTFGITPTEPATGFGYVEAGAKLPSGAHAVTRFVEKPDAEKAAQLVAAGNYFWNSGMFMFAADVFLGECAQLAPDVHDAARRAVDNAVTDLDFVRLNADDFSTAPNISIDYAVFEKTARAAVVPSPIQWSDLGAWDAVWKAGAKDADNNVQRGAVSLTDTTSSLVISEKMHVSVDGLDDIAVIVSEDAVFVGRLSNAQNVGAVVKGLEANPDTAALTQISLTSYRPWGGYTSVLNGERFQVKRLFVKPGKQLSLQKHHHRSEHWVVVRGTAEVRVGDDTMMLSENQSVYIPQGALHRLTNPGKIVLELIEVQTGAYLGEDDIIRVEDAFGRT